MKRRIIIAVIFLLAGAVVNVALAWHWAQKGQHGGMSWDMPSIEEARSLWAKQMGTSPRRLYAERWTYPQFTETTISDQRLYPIDKRTLRIRETGWPVRSLKRVSIKQGWPQVWQESNGLLWPGVVINALPYAAALWLLISGPFRLRRFIRAKRGRCPACAYPVGPSDVCSECGKPLPGRMAVTT